MQKTVSRNLPVVTLKPGRERPVLNRHPWIFSGAIKQLPNVPNGSLVDVVSSDGRFLGCGYANAQSQIQVRLLTFESEATIDGAFWRERLRDAIERRRHYLNDPNNSACRLVFSESDLLPGLIVDYYGDAALGNWVVVQALTGGIERVLEEISGYLMELLPIKGVWARNDAEVRKLEGLELQTRSLRGAPPPVEGITIIENGWRFQVDLHAGHKTGFYLDQRNNRAFVATIAKDREVLNCFSYTGGFSVAAAKGGAKHVVSVDSSQPALDLTTKNMALNGITDTDAHQELQADVFELLRELRQRNQRFDLIILDPPKLAQNQRQVDTAARAYKDLNMIAMQLLNDNGTLVTFSCSGLVDEKLFGQVIFAAATDAKTNLQIVRQLSQADDHPVLVAFPEAAYLKGLVCRKINGF